MSAAREREKGGENREGRSRRLLRDDVERSAAAAEWRQADGIVLSGIREFKA